jgi:putative ABC transport system permease protein
MLSYVLQGWRSWKSAKAVALLAAAALAIGIGSATAIYTVVDAVLLRPLPWLHGERFVALFGAEASDPGRRSSMSWLDLLDYQQRTRSFDRFGIYQPREFNLTAPGEPQHLTGVEVTPSLLNSLGVNPLLGRWFDQTENDQNLAVVSSRLWSRLGSDPNIVGKSLTLDGRRYTVTGVAAAGFRLPVSNQDGGEFRSDIWVPLRPQGADRNRDTFSFFAYARLKPGVTVTQANADVKRVAAELAKDYPKEHPPGHTAFVIDLREVVVKQFRPSLLLLFGSAGVLLLITCANVAGLLLARSVLRARETAIRVALGAAQWQMALQYLVEGLLVSLAGAAGGILVSLALVRFVLSVAADYLPLADGISVNWTALLFALAAAIVASILLTLAPLWQAVRTPPNEALGEGTRASAAGRSRAMSRWLVIAEIALAFTLLAAGALLLAHLDRLLRVPPGFDPDHLLTFAINTSDADYPDMARRVPYQKRLLQAIEQIPGVSGAAFVNQVPIEGCCFVTTIFAEGRTPDPKSAPPVSFMVISPGYFQTMRIPLQKGEGFDGSHDTDGDTLHVVVDRAAAALYWPDRDAVGAYARTAGGDRLKVVGIVGDVRNDGLAAATVPEIYLPAAIVAVNPMRFVVRSAAAPAILLPELRRAVLQVNPAQPIYAAKNLRDIIQDSMGTQRLESFLTAFFAAAALLLAALGVYGVVSYSVRHRTVEIGTRMALGASSRDVLSLVMGDGLTMAAWGIGIGAVAVAGAAWLLSLSIFGVHVDGAQPFLYSTAMIAGITAMASFFPAWRATLVSPLVAIRNDTGSIWSEVAARVSKLIASPFPNAALDEGALLTRFVDASRDAESFRQAIQSALLALREAIGCESAWLMEKSSDAQYKGTGANACSVPSDGVLIARLRNYSLPLPLTEGDLDAWLRWASAQKPEHVAEIECLCASGARLAVPLRANQEIAGILLMGAPIGRDEFSAAERRVLRTCAAQFALMIENANLNGRIVEQEKLRRDVQLAVEVQKRLMPEKPPVTSAVSLAGMSLPARSVGGDYYDFLELGNQRIGIALADVAGKGVPAALIMSVVQASLRILATDDANSLSSLAAKMNHFLHRSTGSNAYATFFYAQIDQRTMQLRYVNAGHNPPYLLRYSAVEELPAGGTVIGLFPRSSYEEATIDLLPGDVLMAFTDGVPEALNPQDEEFGEERLRSMLGRVAHLGVDEMASEIAREMKDWIADAVQYDDLTFILVKVNQSRDR